jgi:hypothetical protein
MSWQTVVVCGMFVVAGIVAMLTNHDAAAMMFGGAASALAIPSRMPWAGQRPRLENGTAPGSSSSGSSAP